MGFLSDIFDFAFGWLVPDIPKAEIGVDVTKANTDANIPILYGRGYGSGLLVYQATNDADNDDIKNDLLHQIVVWGEGNCGGITNNFVDDEQSSSSRFNVPGGRVYYARNFVNGITSYNDPLLNASGKRTTDTYNGKLVSYIRSEMVPDVWQGQPDHKAEWTGRKISTPSGGAATSSENPISQLYDLLKSPIYGKGLSTSKLVVSSFQSERPICDIQVETFSGSGVNRKLFTSNVSLDTSNSVIDNVNTLLKACRGFLFHSDGKLKVLIEKDDEPVDFTLDEKEIGFVSWGKITNSNKSNRYNRVICRYTDPESGWTKQEAIYPAPGSEREAELLAEDNGVLLEKSITLDTCIYYNEAHKHASTILEVSRQQLRSSVIWGPEASILEVGDILPAYRAAAGWAGKLFRIESVEKSLSTGEVSLRLREHQPYIYDDQNTGDKPELPDTTIAYNRPATPTNLSSTDVYDEFTQVNIAWLSTTTDHQVIILDDSEVQIINTGVAGKLYSVKQLEVGDYTINVYAVGGLGRKSLVASLDFSIAAKITYIWYVYADDDEGTGISLSPVDKAFFGIVAGQRSPTVSIADPDIFDYYTNPDGSQGLPGKDGESGQTSYLHIAYATNNDGSTGFSVSDSNNKTYIGQYTDFTQADSTDNTDYSWTLIKGEDGYANLLRNDAWVVGTSGSQGAFKQNGSADENAIILSEGPLGMSEAIWHSTDGDDSSDGGWYARVTDIDHTKTYRQCVWMKSTGTGLTNYFGCGSGGETNSLDGNPVSNPYHWSGNLPTLNKWFLVVGVIHGSSYTGSYSGISGVYDPVSGERVVVGIDFKNKPAAISQLQRAYRFYVSNQSDESYFARPRFEIINGEEFSLQEILGRKAQDGVQGLQGEDGKQGILGLNGSNGTSSYFHIAYADTSSGGGFSQSPTNKEYIGTYVDSNSSDASSGSSLWRWQLVKGSDGRDGSQGLPGKDGESGQTSYLHIAYATNNDGSTGFSVSDSNNKTYIGQYIDFTQADSTDNTDYSWALIKGEDGYANLLRNDTWVVGTSGSQGAFKQNGSADENAIILSEGPLGMSEAIWHSTDGNDSSDGGWNARVTDIDHTKTYRQCVWMKSTGIALRNYFGCGNGGETNSLNGNPASNPYHWYGDLPTLNKWFLVVGVIHGSSYTGSYSGISGVYDPVSGDRVVVGTDFKNKPAAISQAQRVYRYYVRNQSHESYFARPRFEIINGEEFSLQEILGRKAQDGVQGPEGRTGPVGLTGPSAQAQTLTISGASNLVPGGWVNICSLVIPAGTWEISVSGSSNAEATSPATLELRWRRSGTVIQTESNRSKFPRVSLNRNNIVTVNSNTQYYVDVRIDSNFSDGSLSDPAFGSSSANINAVEQL